MWGWRKESLFILDNLSYMWMQNSTANRHRKQMYILRQHCTSTQVVSVGVTLYKRFLKGISKLRHGHLQTWLHSHLTPSPWDYLFVCLKPIDKLKGINSNNGTPPAYLVIVASGSTFYIIHSYRYILCTVSAHEKKAWNLRNSYVCEPKFSCYNHNVCGRMFIITIQWVANDPVWSN